MGIVVDDLTAATALFVELGLKLQGKGPVEGGRVAPTAECGCEVLAGVAAVTTATAISAS